MSTKTNSKHLLKFFKLLKEGTEEEEEEEEEVFKVAITTLSPFQVDLRSTFHNPPLHAGSVGGGGGEDERKDLDNNPNLNLNPIKWKHENRE